MSPFRQKECGAPRWTTVSKSQTSTAVPAEPGILPIPLGGPRTTGSTAMPTFRQSSASPPIRPVKRLYFAKGSGGGAFLLLQILKRHVFHMAVDPGRPFLLFAERCPKRRGGINPHVCTQTVSSDFVLPESIVGERVLQNFTSPTACDIVGRWPTSSCL
jgi:hypothetical protein